MKKIKIAVILDTLTLFFLYVVAFQLPISKAVIEVASSLAIVCFVLKKILERKEIESSWQSGAIVLYLSICLLSVFLSINPKISARTFFGKTFQEALFLFVVFGTLNTDKRIRNFILILLFSSCVLGIDGIYQYFTHKDFIRNRKFFDIPRIHATFPSANDFGCYLVAMIPFSLSFFSDKTNSKKLRFLFIALFFLLFACLLLTVSRGAWFAFLASMIFMGMWVPGLIILLFITLILILSVQRYFFPLLKDRLRNIFSFFDHSGSDRDMIWQAAWNMFLQKPIIGFGLGTFMFNFMQYVNPGYRFTVPYAHNCYLQMASEIGIIGLVSFLSILVLFFASGIEALYTKKKVFSWFVLLAAMASLLGYCVQMVVDTVFYSLDLGILFWLTLGLGIAAMRRLQTEPDR